MYAVIKTGGKQYRVSHGDRLKVESLSADAGESVTIDHVLMVGEGESVTVGTPLVEGASVNAEIVSHGRGDKIKIIKFRRRKHHRKQMGHRQNYTEIEITGITANGVTTTEPPPGKAEAAAAGSKGKGASKSSASKSADAGSASSGNASSGNASSGSANNDAAVAGAAAAATAGVAAASSSSDDNAAAAGGSAGEAVKFLDGPNGEADDLTQINGVGPVLVEKLHDMGIYHFYQVAAFSPEDVEKVNEQLSFKGRIEREEWIPQATKLAGAGIFLDAPDGEKDDLTRISGVGAVLEEKLNNMGIFHFRQVAAFTPGVIDMVNGQLSFKGRIQREEWVEQATKLAEEN